jgi:hypothetical protein
VARGAASVAVAGWAGTAIGSAASRIVAIDAGFGRAIGTP